VPPVAAQSAPPDTQPSTVALPPEPAPARAPPQPAGPRRRGPGEDLIGELFEAMHDLHFATDVVSGAQFVLSILEHMLPSEGVLVHVFDINTRNFVVVRAAGPNASKAILQRTPDKETLFVKAMRGSRCLRFDDASELAHFKGGRWEQLGVAPKSMLCGPVAQGGRYLGMIELANPNGGGPYHEAEANALDYICEQFADFVAARPVIVDADVVLAKD
jgi:GAF domain-containing protein